jgi:hypothetical protein
MRRALPIIVALGIVAAIILSAQAQAPPCGDALCTYLPIVANPPTPTTAPTVAPTATATAQPTSEPSGVFIRTNHSSYTNSIGSLHIVGEVQNNTNKAIEFVKISANLFNGTQLVATDFTYTSLNVVRSHERTCFDVLITNPPAYTSYVFEAPTYTSTSAPNLALTPIGVSTSIDSSGDYHILGQVRNDMTVQVKFVQEVGTLYNAAGTALACDFTYVNSTDLAPGQTSAFDMAFFGRSSYADVATYHLQLDGQPQ